MPMKSFLALLITGAAASLSAATGATDRGEDARITVVGTPIGPIKRMNAVDGAPGRPGTVDFEAWKALEIPYARTHDLDNHAEYGAPWALDVTRIFVDFDADENDPKNYRFAETDALVKRIQDAGTKVFYRLGCPFENQLRKKPVESGMPKDPEKYARLCGNIIAHYNAGWANGFRYGIEYWEFWNEPDLGCFWAGTRDEFQSLWMTVAKHVKGRFPEIKFGGPAVSGDMGWVDRMIGAFAKEKVPLDFVSWHCYQPSPNYKTRFARYVQRARDVLDRHGYTKAESILNEWNYCLSMNYPGRRYSGDVHAGREAAKGAAFVGGVMNICQDGPLDMLMFYSGIRGRNWNSMFDLRTNEPLPGYYAFYAWKKLVHLGTQVKVSVEPGQLECLTAVAAVGKDGRHGLFVSNFTDDGDKVLPVDIALVLPGTESRTEVLGHLTDERRLYTEVPLVRAADGSWTLKLNPNALAYVEY